ncbi:hypothetical protein HMPREF9166_0820 [Selenomonas sp. oral taxon 149 str. 67H29BP]|nr:hypothetical protein HMPREF9166_0820 [Selenomonas sp. oral taxon 149 str. 67H29BP]
MRMRAYPISYLLIQSYFIIIFDNGKIFLTDDVDFYAVSPPSTI